VTNVGPIGTFHLTTMTMDNKYWLSVFYCNWNFFALKVLLNSLVFQSFEFEGYSRNTSSSLNLISTFLLTLFWQCTYMGIKCRSLLVDMLLYLYETDLMQVCLKKNEKKLARSFNFTFSYIDEVLSLNTFLVLWLYWSHLISLSLKKPRKHRYS